MRLISLTVKNYRIHHETTVTFDPSRNLIGGPNEAGKSTLAEAAHRVLFLRAKTGGNLQKEMTSAHHLGDPEVKLTFEAEGTQWELEKRFAGPVKGSTRLTARNGAALRDEEAENRLAALLKTETASGRGAAGMLPGLWAHLWVWQGQAGNDPSAHATAHRPQLMEHLQQNGPSAILQSAADQKAASRIAASYAELFTPTGKPKAGSLPELARVRTDEAAADLAKAREAAARLAQAADDHSRASGIIAEAGHVIPDLRAGLADTAARLQQAATLRQDESLQLQSASAATARREEWTAHDQAIRLLQSQIEVQTAALLPANATEATLAAAGETAREASQAASLRQLQATEAVRLARLHHDLAAATVISLEKTAVHERLASRALEMDHLREQCRTLRQELAGLPALETAGLARLRKLESEAGQAQAALQAMATRVEVLESSAPVQLDGGELAPGQSRILTDSGELVIGPGTRVRIHPGGGTSLAAARARAATAAEELASALQSHALRTMEQAISVLEQRRTLDQQIAALETQWKALGGGTLTAELARAAADLDSARGELQLRSTLATGAGLQPPAVTGTDAAREFAATTRSDLNLAETAEALARQQAEICQEKLAAATAALTRHQEITAAARQHLRDLETTLRTREQTHGDETARTRTLALAHGEETAAVSRLAACRAALATLQPDSLTADHDRFTRALAAQETRLRDAENTRLLARDRLTLDGSADPAAALVHAAARHAEARDRQLSEERRAQAISTLHQLFTSSRSAIDRALIQPLADRISGYLQRLFGPGTQARVQLSAAGIEGLELIRPEHQGTAFPFDSLSGGAREQTAAAVRLALAEILAEGHDGCLPVIFDDAFAYSDTARIQALQRMLDLAAARGLQVIVLTCDPAGYSAFGAAEHRLPGHSASPRQRI